MRTLGWRLKRSYCKSPISATQRVCTHLLYGPAGSAGFFLILSPGPPLVESLHLYPGVALAGLRLPGERNAWPGVLNTMTLLLVSLLLASLLQISSGNKGEIDGDGGL